MVKFGSLRYAVFARNANKVLQTALDKRGKENYPGNYPQHTTHGTHISKILSIDEVREILASDNLRATNSWMTHFSEMHGLGDKDISLNDYLGSNAILEDHDARAAGSGLTFQHSDHEML